MVPGIGSDMADYVELHCHSYYSFQEGASSIDDLVLQAQNLGYVALALTDHDNLCGAMEFTKACKAKNIHPIIGAEVTLLGGYHITLLVRTTEGYSNLCRLLSSAHVFSERRHPQVDPNLFQSHAEGLIALSGCRSGEVPSLVMKGRLKESHEVAKRYIGWFGKSNYFVELQQNLVHGDTERNARLVKLAEGLGVPLVATNNVHYHVKNRHRLQDCLVAISHSSSLDETHQERRANAEFFLKPAQAMESLFQNFPEAVRNTVLIANRCQFDLTRDLSYRFPSHSVPEGHTPQSYLEQVCMEAAQGRYGAITPKTQARLEEEFRLIKKHDLAGFFLIYQEIIQLAREVQVDLGLVNPEVPIIEAPPGRGRGSSVVMLVGYLIGLSHIDPLQYDLPLHRFLPEEVGPVPDIDLDFPRNIREELIKRVHQKYGWDHAALTGMFSTYHIRGAIRDLGKALGLPSNEVDKLAKRVEHTAPKQLYQEMLSLPDFKDKADAPVWRDLVKLARQIGGFPRYLGQHSGGMIISSTPLINQVPIQRGGMEGRYICQWDKDSIDDANFVKIDFLALGALSQMQEAIQLIKKRTGHQVDLSRIDFDDPAVYDMLCNADTIGIFQVESAAQIQTLPRLQPRNLIDMAHEVAAVRPGVGVNEGVSQYLLRRREAKASEQQTWKYTHQLEQAALERTYGVILFQDQVNQVAMDVAGFNSLEADQLRRAFTRKGNEELIEGYSLRFLEGAAQRGIDKETAQQIFRKFNGQYMFPEAHAVAFGVTAYQMSWLKFYYPLEFTVAIFNQQPMGFYNLETLKEDAKRHGVSILNPEINHSAAKCVIEEGALRLGFLNITSIGPAMADIIVHQRQSGGAFTSIADFMERASIPVESLESLADAGAFDLMQSNRRAVRWEIGLRHRTIGQQLALSMPITQDRAELPPLTDWDKMAGEYKSMHLHPSEHVMAYVRNQLRSGISPTRDVWGMKNGSKVAVAGLVIRRQRPAGKAVFLTLEDEYGQVSFIIWPIVYQQLRHILREPFLVARGTVSRREGTMNIIVQQAEMLKVLGTPPASKNWG